MYADLTNNSYNDLGFPGAVDLPDMTALRRFERVLLNNVGHPYAPGGAYRLHTKTIEHEVVQLVADLFDAPLDNRSGYVTTGSTESMLWALWQARQHIPDAAVFASTAAHYSVSKNAELLGMPVQLIPADSRGEIRYDLLHTAVERYRRRHRGAGVVVIASVGSTMTETIDDVSLILEVLDHVGVPDEQRWIHSDAALSGIPLALCDRRDRPAFTFVEGAHSVAVSGHKFLATPFPCGIVVALADRHAGRGHVTYTAAPDSTITGSRSGHAPLWLWYLLRHWGIAGLRQRAEMSRGLARYAEEQLCSIGWPAWRSQQHAFTVVFPRPPQLLLDRWPLAVAGSDAHIVCMPGKGQDIIDRFVSDLHAALGGSTLRRAMC